MPKGKFFYDIVTLKVEDDLYRVPKHHLETWSQVFRDMFALPPRPNVEGQSKEDPIVLSGCTSREFDSLMTVLLTPSFVKLNLTKEEWVSTLKLATMWDMSEVRELSIEKLSALNCSSSEKVALGRQYNVRAWFLDGLVALMQDKGSETTLEGIGSSLGWEFAARIAWASRLIPSPPRAVDNPLKLDWSCVVCSRSLEVGYAVPDRATVVDNKFSMPLTKPYARCLRIECFCPNSACPGVNLNQVNIGARSPASGFPGASAEAVMAVVKESFANGTRTRRYR